jgi:hypothetical protein
MFGALLWIASSASAIDCPKRLSRDDLTVEVANAEQAYADLDMIGFRDRMNNIGGLLLPCMGDLVPPELAARTHRVMALQQLELGNPDAAAVTIAAAHAVDSTAEMPEGWLPADHPLRLAWSAAPDASFAKAPEPRAGTLAFDGHGGRERPKNLPTIVQMFDGSGIAQTTAYIGPGDPLPAYDAIPHRRNTLLISAGGAGAGGLVLLAASWLHYQSLVTAADDPTTPADDLLAGRAGTNTLYAGGAALIGLGIGFTVGAVAVGPQ